MKIRQALLDEYLHALVERNEGYLNGGRHAELVAPLRQLIEEHPVDERPVGQLMLALYRSGRAGEALDEYQAARQRLAEVRGSDPSPYLRQLQQRILRDDPTLAGTGPPAPPALPIPAGLPHDVPGFVGRRAELGALDALVPATNARRTVVISAVHGTAGVGKTALALHWAHRVKSRFPDGNLYADLHGYGPGRPVDPGLVLDGFLAALDVAPPKIPPDLDAKAALYRSLLDERHMLVVLDNAADPQQVRPLLPGSPGCLVLVTSRGALTGLVARDRAKLIHLDVLSADDAVALLAEFLGADRVKAQPQAAHQLARQCAFLPVALCAAGARAAVSATRDLAELVNELADQLADQQRRLDLLDAGGDPEAAVRAAFSWSYAALPPAVARAFRLGSAMTPELTFGQRLRWHRERTGKTRAVLGGLVGRSEEWVNALEAGKQLTPRLPLLLRLAEVLGVKDLAELTGDQSLLDPHAGDDQLAMWGRLNLALARTHSQAGRAGAAWRHWDAATDAVAALGPGYRHPSVDFSRFTVDCYGVAIEADLFRPGAAIQRGAAVDLGGTPSRTRRAVFLMDVARAHLQRREYESVMRLLSRAYRESSETVRHRPFARQAVLELTDRPGTVRDDARKLALAIGLLG